MDVVVVLPADTSELFTGFFKAKGFDPRDESGVNLRSPILLTNRFFAKYPLLYHDRIFDSG
ncbi:MAG: hypothetical protein QF351_07470, partial [Phycisphaerales bacterium]|nr:hypothetical protein [Phycisphaerales bacterium]